jgi:hypothetical protein
MVTDPTGPPPHPSAAWKAKPDAGEAESDTTVSAAAGETFPYASSACTVATPEQVPAATVWGAVTKTSRSAAPGWTVWS